MSIYFSAFLLSFQRNKLNIKKTSFHFLLLVVSFKISFPPHLHFLSTDIKINTFLAYLENRKPTLKCPKIFMFLKTFPVFFQKTGKQSLSVSALLSVKSIYCFQSFCLPRSFWHPIAIYKWHDRDDTSINLLKEIYDVCDLLPGLEIVFLCVVFILIHTHSGQLLSMGIIRLQTDTPSFERK